jgi:preprotein translocase subunit Sss1
VNPVFCDKSVEENFKEYQNVIKKDTKPSSTESEMNVRLVGLYSLY